MTPLMFMSAEAFQNQRLRLHAVGIPRGLHTGRQNAKPLTSTPNFKFSSSIRRES